MALSGRWTNTSRTQLIYVKYRPKVRPDLHIFAKPVRQISGYRVFAGHNHDPFSGNHLPYWPKSLAAVLTIRNDNGLLRTR